MGCKNTADNTDTTAGSSLPAVVLLLIFSSVMKFSSCILILLTLTSGILLSKAENQQLPVIQQTNFIPGKSYFGRSNYIEYIAGDIPLIISAPHGGMLNPKEIPDRKHGEPVMDSNVDLLARDIDKAVFSLLGHHPHVIICNLKRAKLDCNREVNEAAEGNPLAEKSWHEFQNFIRLAETNVVRNFGKGFYIDLHGQSHPIKRVELGYCLSSRQLTKQDEKLNSPRIIRRTTIANLGRTSNFPFSQILRGTNSLGTLLARRGFPAVPSSDMPNPGVENQFFDGGYNARQHGSYFGGTIDGVQMETNFNGIRDTEENRARFAKALVEALDIYFRDFYNISLKTGQCVK